MESRLSLLGEKAASVLFQLPPTFKADADRLSAFLRMLSPKRRYSIEFRHPSWYSPQIMRLLSEDNISLCISDHNDAPAPWRRTADFVYVRGHGPGGRYKGHYSIDALAAWSKRIRSWKARGCDVFVFFDNDQKSAAPIDALKLKQMLPKRAHYNRWLAGSCINLAFLHPAGEEGAASGVNGRPIVQNTRGIGNWTRLMDRLW